MIVKDEQHIILRCLESVKSFVDFVLIHDTGSSDGTVNEIEAWLSKNGIAGFVRHERWQSFAYNRSKALEDLRQRPDIDFAFMMDADDTLVLEKDFDVNNFKSTADADIYSVTLTSNGIQYRRNLICSNLKDFSFKGVLHEYLDGPANCTTKNVDHMYVISGREGARSKDPDKYLKDAHILEAALMGEKDHFLKSRYLFYAGQSFRDAGKYNEAKHYYRLRLDFDFWVDEKFVSLIEIAKILIKEQAPTHEILLVLDDAIKLAPHRAEAHHEASRLCRLRNKFAEGAEYAKRGLTIPKPADGLFLSEWIYQYGLMDELAVNSYWCREFSKCIDACLKLLAVEQLPADHKKRVLSNLQQAWVGEQQESVRKTKDARWVAYGLNAQTPLINICQVMINRHGGIFDDTIDALMFAFRDLGYRTEHSINTLKEGAVNIVLGSIAFAADENGYLDFLQDRPHIIYQQEQLASDRGYLASKSGFRKLLDRAALIMEYSPAGLKVLHSLGMDDKTVYVPPLYHPILESYRPVPQPGNDVILYGSWTARRQDIMNRLVAEGVKALYLQGVYGEELKRAISDSKIVLNIHANADINNLETVRLSHVLANRGFVVSETSDHNPYQGGVVFCDYGEICDTVRYYLTAGDKMRADVADRGYAIFRQTDLVRCLERMLSEHDLDKLVA